MEQGKRKSISPKKIDFGKPTIDINEEEYYSLFEYEDDFIQIMEEISFFSHTLHNPKNYGCPKDQVKDYYNKIMEARTALTEAAVIMLDGYQNKVEIERIVSKAWPV